MKYTRFFILVCTFIIMAATFVLAQESDDVVLDGFVKEALEGNPRIQQAYSLWQAAEYKSKHVKGLPDPMASYGYFAESVETRVGPQEQKYGLSQKIPFPGKLSLKGKAQSKHAKMLKEKYEATKREIIKSVKFIYYDLFWVDRAIRITEEEKNILESLEKVARRRYESRKTSQQDVIKTHVELSKLADKLYLLKQNRDSLEARMNSILSRDKDVRIEKILDIKKHTFSYTLDELVDMARESRQELVGASLAVERAEYEKSLARLDYFPDFTFGVDYTEIGSGSTTHPDDGQDAWMGKVAVNIPIWFDKLGAQLNEKKANLEAAQKNAEDLGNTVTYEVQDIKFKMDTYKNIMMLYQTALIPQSEQAFDAAKSGYESGKVDFLNWLDAQRTLLQTRLAYYKAVVDYHKSIAYLERVVGRDLL